MTIAHGGAARLPSTSQDTNAGTVILGSYTPTGTPAGIVVILFTSVATAQWTGVLYGGVSMTLQDLATDTTEAGCVAVYTLAGVAIPPGAQDVTVQGATTTAKWAEVFNVTSATNFSAVDSHAATPAGGTTSTPPQIVVATTASTTTQGYGGCHSGSPNTLSGGTGCTAAGVQDYTQDGAQSERRTATDSGGNVTHSFTYATSDDFAFAAVHLKEAPQAIVVKPAQAEGTGLAPDATPLLPAAAVPPDLVMAPMTGV